MLLYSVSENGALRKASKMELVQNRVYLIDDIKTIYLWFGLKASNRKKDMSIKKAKTLKSKREKTANIQIMKQREEYGAFLAIMDLLKEGKFPIKRRKELKIKIEDTMELLEAGIDPDFEGEITIAAHKIAEEKKSYEELCRELAKMQLSITTGKSKASEKEIKEKANEIFKSSSTYEELCWLIAELSKLSEI